MRRLDTQYAIPWACELPVASHIRDHAASVIAAIDLDHEAYAGRLEISDDAEQPDLPPKGS